MAVDVTFWFSYWRVYLLLGLYLINNCMVYWTVRQDGRTLIIEHLACFSFYGT